VADRGVPPRCRGQLDTLIARSTPVLAWSKAVAAIDQVIAGAAGERLSAARMAGPRLTSSAACRSMVSSPSRSRQ